MKLITKKVLTLMGVLTAMVYSQTAVSQTRNNSDIQVILNSKKLIDQVGFEKALLTSEWPKAEEQTNSVPDDEDDMRRMFSSSEIPSDDCTGANSWSAFGCFNYTDPSYGSLDNSSKLQIKDDGVQILATEVLYQTLTYFKVKHVFGKIKGKPNTYGFQVINPVEGQPFQDLDTDAVVYAIKQFRRYIIGLICNDPSPTRVLAMMNRYDVGVRFRWDMAWALLGNDLPDAPNKFMRFGVKWRKFSAAMDGIETGSLMRIENPGGGFTPIDPVPTTGGSTTLAHVGYVAREVVGVIRLAGDIVSAVLELVCINDLSVNQGLEAKKKDVVYKLLDIKKKAYDRYGPLRPILEEIGKKASGAAGQPVSVFP